jgi:HSP20 family protein
MTLARWPFRGDFISLREAMNQLIEDSAVLPGTLQDGSRASFEADLSETPDAYVVKASIPGVKPDDVEITATSDNVTIKGEYKSERDVKEASYLRRERRTGTFERSVGLPLPIDPEKVEATQAEGILTLTLPKSEQTKPKRVQVKVT